MSAMIVRSGSRFAVLIARDANFPAQAAFYLAHELGHAALGHLESELAIVDLGDTLVRAAPPDNEEEAADKFALELLTGMEAPIITSDAVNYSAASLAHSLLAAGPANQIDPGTMALCFGHSTGAWKKAFAAMKLIYSPGQQLWKQVNAVAVHQLGWTALSEEQAIYVRKVIGESRGG
jgi:hypothetical protein